jgi:hypothetical protein
MLQHTVKSASLSWHKAPIWGLRPEFYYCRTVAGLLMWAAVSGERTGLSFIIAADPRQHNNSRVRVPWDSRTYFTISDSRLPFSSPPTTCPTPPPTTRPTPPPTLLLLLLSCRTLLIATLHGSHGKHRLLLSRMRVYWSVTWQWMMRECVYRPVA